MWLYTHTHTHTYTLKQLKKSEKGITLIALVITIIILIILAGVTIVAVTGKNGIMSKSKLARDKYQNSTNEENEKISSYENEIDKTEINIASSRNEIASNLIEYKGIECRLTEENQIKFFKNQKEIWPIYWYGLEPIIEMYNNNIYYWNETNNIPKIIKNEYSFIYSAYMRISYSQCVGGLATGLPIDLTKYKECHMIIKSCNVSTQMQVINRIGYRGSDIGLENMNVILNIPKTDTETEYIGNIERFNGAYYLGVQSWNEKTNLEVLAWWLE